MTANEPLSSEYVSENLVAIEKQVVLGGLRLATVIKTIFGANQSFNFLQ